MKSALLRLEQVIAAAALVPVAFAFGLGVVAWGLSRDLQRASVARVPAVRRVLVWIGGDASAESEVL